MAAIALAAAVPGRGTTAGASGSGSPQATGSSTQPLIKTTVDPGSHRIRIARNFLGLSVEYPHVTRLMGDQSKGTNQVLARLIQHVTAGQNGAPKLRLGGGTADSAWWNPNGAAQPEEIGFDITPAFVSAVKSFRALTYQRLIIDLNFAANRPDYAVDWARAAINGFGRAAISAFEIGNEPDLYRARQLGSHKARPPDWGFDDYLRQVSRFAKRLKELRSWLPLAAPNSCCKPRWDRGLAELARQEGGRLGLVTYHHLVICGPDQMPLQDLLGEKIIHDGRARLGPLAQEAGRHHRRLRITETDPNGCSGDTRYGTALWGIDWMYTLAFLGVQGADFHQVGSTPFDVVYVDGVPSGHFEVSVSPLYYAMLLFARGAGHGARLLPQATFKQQTSKGANARLWATIDRDGKVRVTAINKRSKGGPAEIHLPGQYGGASLQRLRGPDPSTSDGVTLAGESVAKPSTTGDLEGETVIQSVSRRSGGTYRFWLPGFSAAMLVIRHKG